MTNKLFHDRSFKAMASRFATDERGATTIEYGLIVALLGMVIILSLGPIGTALRDDVFGTVASTLDQSTSTTP